MSRDMVSSPPPTADDVDRLYRQLIEIHAIEGAQLVECSHWRRSDPTPSPVQARTAPPPLSDFFSQVSL
jgi:hypothetical protein